MRMLRDSGHPNRIFHWFYSFTERPPNVTLIVYLFDTGFTSIDVQTIDSHEWICRGSQYFKDGVRPCVQCGLPRIAPWICSCAVQQT